MDPVGVTIRLGSYTATVHYKSCGYYTGYHTHENLPIPPSIKIKVCHFCKPSKSAIVSIAQEIKWGDHHADAMSRLAPIPYDDITEKNFGPAELAGGRKLKKAYFGEFK